MEIYGMSEHYELITICRICKSNKLQSIIYLGDQPLANSLLKDKAEKEIFVPLELMRCDACTTIQLSVNVNPELMFKEYFWVTGTTNAALSHLENLTKFLQAKNNKEMPRLLEVGCNDGSLLKLLKENSFGELMGVDPAKNIIDSIDSEGLQLYAEFFDLKFAKKFITNHKLVDFVIARNVFSHVPDVVQSLEAVSTLLDKDGIFVMEFHEANKIVNEFHYDSIYHEHTFYHSIRSISEAALRAGLHPFDIDTSPISGGSFILYFDRKIRDKTKKLINYEESENNSGVLTYDKWKYFADNSKLNITAIRNYLVTNDSKKICGFGASARSSTLMNAVGKEFKSLVGIADNNSHKSRKFSPGLHILIEKPCELINSSVEIIILFPFNFEEEILNYLKGNLNWSGEVFIPLPNNPRIITI
jgi:SAM-dependent methyltransferase